MNTKDQAQTLTIGECDENVAFITNAEGFDIATLRRVSSKDYASFPAEEELNPQQWQNLIDTITNALDASHLNR